MKNTIILLALVVATVGYHVNEREHDLLRQLQEKLKAIVSLDEEVDNRRSQPTVQNNGPPSSVSNTSDQVEENGTLGSRNHTQKIAVSITSSNEYIYDNKIELNNSNGNHPQTSPINITSHIDLNLNSTGPTNHTEENDHPDNNPNLPNHTSNTTSHIGLNVNSSSPSDQVKENDNSGNSNQPSNRTNNILSQIVLNLNGSSSSDQDDAIGFPENYNQYLKINKTAPFGVNIAVSFSNDQKVENSKLGNENSHTNLQINITTFNGSGTQGSYLNYPYTKGLNFKQPVKQTLPSELNMKEIFTFPGSNFIERLFTENVIIPLPKDPSFLEDPYNNEAIVNDVNVLQGEMIHVYRKYGTWSGINEMIAMKITKRINEVELSCPAMIFHKIFINWISVSLDAGFANIRVSLYNKFISAIKDVFPDAPAAWHDLQASSVIQGVIITIKRDIITYLFDLPLRGVATFSHIFYNKLWNGIAYYNGKEFPDFFLRDVVDSSVEASDLRCRPLSDMFYLHRAAIAMLSRRWQRQNGRYWMSRQFIDLSHMWPESEELGKPSEFKTDKLEQVFATIPEYAQYMIKIMKVLARNAETTDMEYFLTSALGEEYSDFITVLLQKLEETE